MKKLILLLVPVMMLAFACNNTAEKKTDEQQVEEKTCDKAKEDCHRNKMTVDSLLNNLPDYVDKEVSVCGKCTHICQHGGKRIFLASPNDLDLVIIGMANDELGSFNDTLVGENVRLKGILRAVTNEDEVETHHDIEVRYYIEVSEAKLSCCKNKKNHCGEKHHENE